MTFDELINELKKININLNEEQQRQIKEYATFLLEYNKHTNLTAIRDINDCYLKHFYDSLTIVNYIDLNKYNNILDIGTGAGFPGLVLKIVYPKLNVTLLDSNNKKVSFLKEISSKLEIDVTIINDRAENYIKNNREAFDIVVSRAVASLPVLLELTIPFVKVNGYFISMKGNAQEELEISKNTHSILGAKIDSINEFKLIKEQSNRTIIIYKKEKETDNKYPRIYDKIIKKHL